MTSELLDELKESNDDHYDLLNLCRDAIWDSDWAAMITLTKRVRVWKRDWSESGIELRDFTAL